MVRGSKSVTLNLPSEQIAEPFGALCPDPRDRRRTH